mmetsp:Transcript_15573/g.17311  ORF Transcript_15573/g.17311 Transcript_15573/m.17311 type:complete len:159 (+) Transcript_15573:52-528(+)
MATQTSLLLTNLPPELHYMIFNFDDEVRKLWASQCTYAALSSNFDNNFEKHGVFSKKLAYGRVTQAFKHGIKHGTCKRWFSNGQMELCCSYNNGVLHGECLRWDANGVLRRHCWYKNGKFDGEYLNWFENGQLACKKRYTEGRLMSTKKWNRDGSTHW